VTAVRGSVALGLLLACHRGDDSAAAGLWTQVKVDCVALEQPSADGTSVPSGYEYCAVDSDNGFVHRVTVVDAATDPTGVVDKWCSSKDASGTCATNAECAAGSACESDAFGFCECVAKCTSDADCGAGYACVPNGGNANYECVPAECSTDADCPSQWCVVSETSCGDGTVSGLHCFGPHDECVSDADCDGSTPLCHVSGGAFQCDGLSSCQ
jgi:hypothetical protein